MKKLCSLLLSAVMTISAAAYAAAEELTVPEEIISPGTVETMTISSRLKTNVVAKIGTKTVLYGLAHNSGGLYAYDITDGKNAVQIGSSLTAASYDNKEAAMYVKDAHLIFANGNNVQVNELNSDGSVGAQVFSDSTGGIVASLAVADDLLFASSENSNKGIVVYDISDVTNISMIGSITAQNSVRSLDVEKMGNGTYRIYSAVKASVDNISTIKLLITDISYNEGVFEYTRVLDEAIPQYEGFGWQGYGYTATDSGIVTLLSSGYIEVESNNSGRFLIDATDPSAAKVIDAETVSNNAFRQRKLKLDSSKIVEISKNGNGIWITDYSDVLQPNQISEITNMRGEGASIFENYLYTTIDGQICRLKLYDEYELSEPAVEKSDGSISVTVNVDNYVAHEVNMVLIAAIYKDGKMINVEFNNAAIEANARNSSISVNLDASGQEDYTFKTWVFDNFNNMNLLTDVVYE